LSDCRLTDINHHHHLAMTGNPIIIFTAGAVAGLTIGMAVAGLLLMERKIITRLQPWLYDRLRKSASGNRLQTSFDADKVG
jgi:hypothetical protein